MSEYTDGEIVCLCSWLRMNSSGVYRKCDDAAGLIERQQGKIKQLEKELHDANMEIVSKYSKDMYHG